jgi:hypothetical protein
METVAASTWVRLLVKNGSHDACDVGLKWKNRSRSTELNSRASIEEVTSRSAEDYTMVFE